jgi:hypothetical protein
LPRGVSGGGLHFYQAAEKLKLHFSIGDTALDMSASWGLVPEEERIDE